MNSSTPFLLLAVGLAILPQASHGQRIASLTHFAAPEASTRRYPATYYFEGAVIGAGVLATTVALIWYELGCHYSEQRSDCAPGRIIGAGLVGAFVGGTVGALAGGLIAAPRPRPLRGNPVKAALIGACAGAIWGFGPFSHFCLNGCHSDQVVIGLSTTAVGALAGLLVGR
jgi:hypothetical protein